MLISLVHVTSQRYDQVSCIDQLVYVFCKVAMSSLIMFIIVFMVRFVLLVSGSISMGGRMFGVICYE